MSRIIKEGKLPILKTENVQFTLGGRKYSLDVKEVLKMTVTNYMGDYRISLDCNCASIESEPVYDPRNDFMEDVKALAKQYGLELVRVEVK